MHYNSTSLNQCCQTLQHGIFFTPIKHDECTTYFVSILFEFPFGGGGGGGGLEEVKGFFWLFYKRKYSFCYLPMIIAFWTLNEIELGGSNLGM